MFKDPRLFTFYHDNEMYKNKSEEQKNSTLKKHIKGYKGFTIG